MTVAFVRGTTTRRVTLMLAMILLLLSSLVTAPIAAQTSEGSFTFDGGQTLTWGDDWELDEDSVALEDGVESALFFRGVSVLSVLTVPNDFDLNQGRDIFLDAFLDAVGESVTIDRGSYGQVSYSLDLVNSAGFESGVFTLFRAGSGATPTFAYVFFAEVSEFASEFASAQTTFLLDGEGLFDGVEGTGLQDLLVANTGSAPPPPEEEIADVVETPESVEIDVDPADDANEPETEGLGDLKDRDDDEDAADADADDPPGTGLVDDSTFVSPWYESELQWDRAWEVNVDRDPFIVENGDGGIDYIALRWTGEGATFLTVSFVPVDGNQPVELLELWQTDEFIADMNIHPDGGIVLVEGTEAIAAIVIRDFTDDGTEFFLYREARFDAERQSVVLFNFTTIPALADPSLTAAQAGIVLDDEPVLDFFSVEEVLDALE
ncbi:MAG: hypothetical protein H0U31_02670 [Chloroflexia bacterium]|nr:hypothetical protein [Chloroflexia bacterium]